MNRILFEKSEIHDGVVTLRDTRSEHILNILHAETGDILKTGELDGPIGESKVLAISTDGAVTLKSNHNRESLAPWCDLILAPPRPRVMKRLLPQLAALGVGKIVLVGAKKVEKDFWGATLLREANYHPLLVEGLMQAGTSILPAVEARRNFRKFVADELDVMFPLSRRIMAHPYVKAETENLKGESRRPLFAIGPEGGWTDDEVEMFVAKGFEGVSLGTRILRTETAAIALLARYMQPLDGEAQML